jgi:hypothetical protein
MPYLAVGPKWSQVLDYKYNNSNYDENYRNEPEKVLHPLREGHQGTDGERTAPVQEQGARALVFREPPRQMP